MAEARLTLDSAKAAAKSARPERAEAAHADVDNAEDAFVAAVEESVTLMKSVVESSEAVRRGLSSLLIVLASCALLEI